MNLNQANVVVCVFTMQGCPACEDYLPRFRALAAQYAGQFPILFYDADDPRDDIQDFCDRVGVKATPTTAVLRRGPGAFKTEGALTDAQIREVLELARRNR